MDNSWSLLKRFQPRDSHDSRADGLPHAGGRAQGSGGNGPAPQDPVLALGAIGMEDELIRSRISHMVERLDDVATLKNDFAALLEPIAAFGSEYPQLRAKLLETEAMLAREREGDASLAQQVRTVRSESVKLQDQLSAMSAHKIGRASCRERV